MNITVEQFKILLQKNNYQLNILDIRPKMSFDTGHIKGAISMPIEQIDFRWNELDKEKIYYIICSVGVRSSKATALLNQHGYQAINIEGGMLNWNDEVAL